MRTIPVILAALFTFSLACSPPPPEQSVAPASADEAGDEIVADYLERYFAFYPSRATAAGLHDHDRALEDLSEERIAAWVDFNRRTAERLEERMARDDLEKDVRLDSELLLRHVRRELFAYDTIEQHRTRPLFWTGIASNANVFLLVREDLPAAERLASATERARAIPRLAEQARTRLGSAEPADVAPEHARIAAGQARASATFYREGFAEAARQLGEETPESRRAEIEAAMEEAGRTAATALGELADALSALAEEATGSPRLGPQRYTQLFRMVNGVDEPLEAVLRRAGEALAAKREETAAYGREVWDEVLPDEEPPSTDQQVIARLFERVARDRAETVEQFVTDYRHLVERAFVFTREHEVMTLPEERTLWVGRSPSYFIGQSVGGVYPAGPYAPDADTLFYLPTPPADATAEERDAFFRDFNHHFNVMITPHEIVPGHYTQLKIAAHQSHKVRALFPDGVYTEGWGTFSERLMLDLGWGGPLDRLAHLKKQLENIARTIVDVRVHTDGMEREEVLRFVREEALQDDQFARNMWTRSITSAPQLTSYWLGYEQVMGLYEDVREERGEDFVLRELMDGMMSMGPVPVRHYREAMLGGRTGSGG